MYDCCDVCGIGAPGLTVALSVRFVWEVIIGPDRLGTGTFSDWLITVLLGRSWVGVAVRLIAIVAGSEFCTILSVLHCITVVVSITSTKCIERYVNKMIANNLH